MNWTESYMYLQQLIKGTISKMRIKQYIVIEQ